MSASHPEIISTGTGSGGFTLLELMVVLGLVSLIGAVTFPGLLRFYESVQRSNEQQEIIAAINRLGMRAFESRRPLDLASSLDLPDGWQVNTVRHIRYRANGVCTGGVVNLIHDEMQRRRITLEAPFCQVSDEN